MNFYFPWLINLLDHVFSWVEETFGLVEDNFFDLFVTNKGGSTKLHCCYCTLAFRILPPHRTTIWLIPWFWIPQPRVYFPHPPSPSLSNFSYTVKFVLFAINSWITFVCFCTCFPLIFCFLFNIYFDLPLISQIQALYILSTRQNLDE